MKLLSCKLESRNLILFNDKGGKLIFSHLKSMVGTCILNWNLKKHIIMARKNISYQRKLAFHYCRAIWLLFCKTFHNTAPHALSSGRSL